MNYLRRQKAIEKEISRRRWDAMLVTHPANLRYLCGFTGSAGALLLFTAGTRRPAFFTDGRYTEQARQEVQRARVTISRQAPAGFAARHAARLKLRNLGVEAEHTSLAASTALRQALGGGPRLREASGLVESARMIKEGDEIKAIQAAARLGVRLLDVALTALRPGVREVEVAGELEHAARKAGASEMSFDTIVASGPRSALPHGHASTARIPANGFVILDFGVTLDGYCSDMTRTVHMGRCTAAGRRMYQAVWQAQEAAVAAVGPGVSAGAVDAAARSVLRSAGLDQFFTHSTGHGVGLEIHEPPRLGRGQEQPLEPGMVVTIEPGVYIAGKGGVRIEDMVVVTAAGGRVLTPAPRELIEL